MNQASRVGMTQAAPVDHTPDRDRVASSHVFDPGILRAYDIRGTVGRSLGDADALHVGRAFGTVLARRGGTRAVVGFDGRLTSPGFADLVAEGLVACGISVAMLGLASTPMVYYAARERGADGCVIVTGSHNPATHNGFKFMLGAAPFFGQDIKDLARIAADGAYQDGTGAFETVDALSGYLDALLAEGGGAAAGRALRVAWDPGNGATGPLVEALVARLPGHHVVINAQVDGTFPAHHPDPSRPDNLSQLCSLVLAERCDLGIAFDGDGDRLGVVDETGAIIGGEQLMLLFAREILAREPGATLVSEIKASQTLFDTVEDWGGRARVSPTGHSPIKAMMKEVGAVFAGDLSGHFFFADRYHGFDDGAYAAMRLIRLVSEAARPLSALAEELPRSVSTPEIRFACPDSRKFVLVETLARRLKATGADLIDIDGVRVNIGGGAWWLLRASNTEAALTARCEGTDEIGLRQAKLALASALREAGLNVDFDELFHAA